VLQRFPRDRAIIIRLACESAAFRGMCEDYVLVSATLAVFEKRSDGQNAHELAEYRKLAEELEEEISKTLRHCGPL
jgi:hypothetical protein